MARVNEGSHSFFYLSLTPTRFSTIEMNHTCLYSPAAERHRTLAGILIFRPADRQDELASSGPV